MSHHQASKGNLQLLYTPKPDRKMKVVVLFSGGASAVPFMLSSEDYEVVGAISSSRDASGIQKLEKLGVAVEVLDIREFYDDKPLTDMERRKEYDQELARIASRWQPDIIACSGYMYILTTSFLEAFPNKVLNVHPADLRIMEGGRRKYAGLHVVEKQLQCGEKFTRSTIHLMTEDVDHGPILCVSQPLPFENRNAKEQQELMKLKCDGPAYRKALELLSTGCLAMDRESEVYHKRGENWIKGPYVMVNEWE
jgi:folate-dependent phosphoribosylglycinamide formyltransferase PurN